MRFQSNMNLLIINPDKCNIFGFFIFLIYIYCDIFFKKPNLIKKRNRNGNLKCDVKISKWVQVFHQIMTK